MMENSINPSIGEASGCKTSLHFKGIWDSCDNLLERYRSTIALIVLLMGEIIVVLWLHKLLPLWVCIAAGVLLLVLLLVLIWKSLKTRVNSFYIPSIFTKLLSNAIVPRWLGVWYLLLFVMHISWTTDGALEIITSSSTQAWWSFCIGLLGLLHLLFFFPEGRSIKHDNPLKVFVSGMSTLRVPSDNNYNKLNLRPLVRILNVISDDEDSFCEMLILKSDQNADTEAMLNFLGVDAKSSTSMSHDDKLRLIIRVVAKREFPNKKWIDSLVINFTSACNYDNFPQCSKVLMPKVKELDDSQHLLFFNLTPGTAVVSSLMTLLAIDANRELYYYNQREGICEEERLAKVDKSQIPLMNLLTQALDSQFVGR